MAKPIAQITYTNIKKSKRINRKLKSRSANKYYTTYPQNQHPHIIWWKNLHQEQKDKILKQLYQLHKTNNTSANLLGLLLTTSFKTIIKDKVQFMCLSCRKWFKTSAQVGNHHNKKHKQSFGVLKEKQSDTKCSKCGITFASVQSRKRHERNNQCHSCESCIRQYTKQKCDCGSYICKGCYTEKSSCRRCEMDKQ